MNLLTEYWTGALALVSGVAGLLWLASAIGESWFRWRVVKSLQGIENSLRKKKGVRR